MPKKPRYDDDEEDETPTPKRRAAPAEEEEPEDEDPEEEEADDAEEPESGGEAKSAFSWDTDDAEVGGLPEGRVVLMNAHTRSASTSNYEEDDADGVPVTSITCVPVEGDGTPFNIHLSAGKANRLQPTADGSSFEPAEGSKARGLSKSSNTYYFFKALEDAGFPKDRIRAKGLRAINGTEVELLRVPQPERRGLAAVEPGERLTRTMPSVSEIYSLPWESKGAKARAKAEAALTKKGGKSAKGGRPKAAEVEEEEEEPAPVKAKANGKEVLEAAEKAIVKTLAQSPHRDKGISSDDLYPLAFQLVKAHPQRKHIMALVEDEKWVRHDDRPWYYEDKTDRIRRIE